VCGRGACLLLAGHGQRPQVTTHETRRRIASRRRMSCVASTRHCFVRRRRTLVELALVLFWATQQQQAGQACVHLLHHQPARRTDGTNENEAESGVSSAVGARRISFSDHAIATSNHGVEGVLCSVRSQQPWSLELELEEDRVPHPYFHQRSMLLRAPGRY
jgi:hypothetical protein